MSDVWVVIPTYDEAENLPVVVGAVLDALAGEDHHVLVVDDASPDGTGAIADAIARDDDRVVVLHREGPRGLGRAYAAGLALARESGAELIVQMDADLSHDPRAIGALLAAARGGADLVLGSRYVDGGGTEGWPRRRELLSRWGSAYARMTLGMAQRDLTGGFKCLTPAALDAIDPATLTAQGYAFQIEATFRAVRAGLRVVEVPIVFTERRMGRSKMSPAIALEALWRVPAIRLTERALRTRTTRGGCGPRARRPRPEPRPARR